MIYEKLCFHTFWKSESMKTRILENLDNMQRFRIVKKMSKRNYLLHRRSRGCGSGDQLHLQLRLDVVHHRVVWRLQVARWRCLLDHRRGIGLGELDRIGDGRGTRQARRGCPAVEIK